MNGKIFSFGEFENASETFFLNFLFPSCLAEEKRGIFLLMK
jgi:hypothetical protein